MALFEEVYVFECFFLNKEILEDDQEALYDIMLCVMIRKDHIDQQNNSLLVISSHQ